MMMPVLVLDLQIGASSGWNVNALYTALYATARCDVALLVPPKLPELSDYHAEIIAALPVYEVGAVPAGAITVTGLGNDGENARGGWPVDAPDRRLNVGVIFSESTAWRPEDVARLNTFDLIVAGSTWNAAVLRQHGVQHVVTVFQGIDPAIFHPTLMPRHEGPFRVFSGGKLEYRKGQDIVVAGFREFHATHPDSVLVHAWGNHWPSTIKDIDKGGLVTGYPASGTGPALSDWLARNGVPPDAHEDVGMIPHYAFGDVLRGCDAAIFPNRAEGGTNLVAMEALACGLPCGLSEAHGHLDLPHYVALPVQPVRAPVAGYLGTDGWGATSPAAVARFLSLCHEYRTGPSIPQHRTMLDWSWEKAVNRLLDSFGIVP